MGKPTWLRYVLVPGLTDDLASIEKLAAYAAKLKMEKVEVLPFHKMGESKWEALKLPYTLKDTAAFRRTDRPSQSHLCRARAENV